MDKFTTIVTRSIENQKNYVRPLNPPAPLNDVEVFGKQEEIRRKTGDVGLYENAFMHSWYNDSTVYGMWKAANDAFIKKDDKFLTDLNNNYNVHHDRLAKMGFNIFQIRDILSEVKNPQHLEELIRHQRVLETQNNIYYNGLTDGERMVGGIASVIVDESIIGALTLGMTSAAAGASLTRAGLGAAETAGAVAGAAASRIPGIGAGIALGASVLSFESKWKRVNNMLEAAKQINDVERIREIEIAARRAKYVGTLAALGGNGAATVARASIKEDYSVWDGLFDFTLGAVADRWVLSGRIDKAMHTKNLGDKQEILKTTEEAKKANDTNAHTQAFQDASDVDKANKAKNEAKAQKTQMNSDATVKAADDVAAAADDVAKKAADDVAKKAADYVKTKGKKTSTKTEAADDTTKFNEFVKKEEIKNNKAKKEYDEAMGDDLNTKLGAAKKQREVNGITIEKQIKNLDNRIARTKDEAKKAKLIETRRLYDLERKLGLIAGDTAKYGAVVAGQAKKASTIVEKIQKNINELVDDAIDIPRLKEDLLAFEKEYGGHLQVRVDKGGEVFIDFVESKTKKTQKVGKSNLPAAVVLALAGGTTASMAASDDGDGFPLAQLATVLATVAIGVGTVRAWKQGRPLGEALSATGNKIIEQYNKSVSGPEYANAGMIRKLAKAAQDTLDAAMLPYKFVQAHASPEIAKLQEKILIIANKTSGSSEASTTLQGVAMNVRGAYVELVKTFGTREFSQWVDDAGKGHLPKHLQIDEFGKVAGEYALGLNVGEVHPLVKKTVDTVQNKMRDLYEMAQKIEVKGFSKSIAVENYIPHYFTYSKLRNALTKTLTKFPTTLKEFRKLERVDNFRATMVAMLEKNNYHNFFDSLSEEQLANADKLGELYMKSINEYVDNFIEKVYYSNSEGNLATVGDGISGRAKVRWTLDYQAMHNMQVSDDTVLKLDDILETDLNVVFEKYVNEMAGHIGTKLSLNMTPTELKEVIASEPNKEVRDVLLRMVNELLGHKNFEVEGIFDRGLQALADGAKGTGLVFTTLSNMSEVVNALYLKYRTGAARGEINAFANQFTNLAEDFFGSGLGHFGNQLWTPRGANKHLNDNFDSAGFLEYFRSGTQEVLAFTKWFGLAKLSDFQAMTVMHAQVDSLVRYSHGLPNKLSETDISHIGLNKEEIDLIKKYYKVNEHNVAVRPDWDELKKTKDGFEDFHKLNTVFQRAASMYTPIHDVGIIPDWMRASAFGQFAGNLLGSLYLAQHQIGRPMTKKIFAGEMSAVVQAGLYFSTYMAMIMAKQKLKGKEVDEEKAFYQALYSMPQLGALNATATAAGGGSSWGIVNGTIDNVYNVSKYIDGHYE